MPRTKQPFTDALRRAIAGSGLSVNALADAAGVQRMSIVRFLRGERSLRLDKADALAVFFGLTAKPSKKR